MGWIEKVEFDHKEADIHEIHNTHKNRVFFGLTRNNLLIVM